MLRILLWAPFGAGTHYWGPGTSAYRLYKANKDKNIKVTLIHATDRQDSFPDVYDDQIALPSLENSNIIGKIKYLIAAKRWIRNNYHKYDVVHAITAYEFTFRPMLEFVKLGKPVYMKITGEHGGFGGNSRISKILGLSENREKHANDITGYISISSMIKNNLIKYNIDENRILEIPNGVNTDRFNSIDISDKSLVRKSLGVDDKFTFMYIGGLTFNKRVIELVKAVSLLSKRGIDNFQFIMVGPDRENGLVEPIIEKLIEELHLQDRVVRFAQTSTPELYLQVADVFTLVSESEGMSNSLLEAMSTGLPSLVTNISGSQDLIKDGVNGKYTTGEVEDISNKLEWFINNKNDLQLMGSKSRNLILGSYSDEYVLSRHIEVFKSHIKDISDEG